jgi:hypothetical protein
VRLLATDENNSRTVHALWGKRERMNQYVITSGKWVLFAKRWKPVNDAHDLDDFGLRFFNESEKKA